MLPLKGATRLDNRIPTIVDCQCGLRYMRTLVRSMSPEIGHYRCKCGSVVGAWNGPYRLVFEAEEQLPL